MNSLIEKIEAGEPFIGMKMFCPKGNYASEGEAYFTVKVLGLSARYNDDVCVRVKPVSGHGEIIIAPGRLIDATAKAVQTIENKAKAKKLERMITNKTLVSNRRAALIEAYDKLPLLKREIVNKDLEDRGGKTLETIDSSRINSMARLVADLTYGIED